MILLEYLGSFFLLFGSLFLLVGGIGILRMPDFFTRLHPAGIIDTLAMTLLLAGLSCFSIDLIVTIKLILIFALLLITGPTSSHAIARAALAFGIKQKIGQPTPSQHREEV